MICPNCNKENKNTNIRCENCGYQLISEEIHDNDSINYKQVQISPKNLGCFANLAMIIIFGPWFLFSLCFIGVGTYQNISEHNQTKGYIEATANLKDYRNCHYDEDRIETCNAIYEYIVNGEYYNTSPSKLSNRGGFKKTETVYYNPNNPNESLIYAGWNEITFVGIIMLIITTIIFIVINSKQKKIANNNDTIKLNLLH